MRSVRKIRKKGFVLSTKTVTRGGGVLAMMLPRQLDSQPVAVCLGGVASVVFENADRYARVIHEAIARHMSGISKI
jgi:hypothetical protein